MKTLTQDELGLDAEHYRLVNTWLERGDGIVAYENHDLGHSNVGHRVFFSYGSPAAQFETDELPEHCPDGLMPDLTGGINWRYQLVGVYRGAPLS